MRSDVLKVVTASLAECVNEHCNSNVESDDEVGDEYTDNASGDLLQSLNNIRKRNAGTTSKLCPKAIRRRNEVIHELVKYASFGDVKSKCTECYAFKLYIYGDKRDI